MQPQEAIPIMLPPQGTMPEPHLSAAPGSDEGFCTDIELQAFLGNEEACQPPMLPHSSLPHSSQPVNRSRPWGDQAHHHQAPNATTTTAYTPPSSQQGLSSPMQPAFTLPGDSAHIRPLVLRSTADVFRYASALQANSQLLNSSIPPPVQQPRSWALDPIMHNQAAQSSCQHQARSSPTPDVLVQHSPPSQQEHTQLPAVHVTAADEPQGANLQPPVATVPDASIPAHAVQLAAVLLADRNKKPTGSRPRKSTPKAKKQCLNCATTSTPQWRKGPDGPRTLCNACGMLLRKGKPLKYRQTGAG